MIAFAAKRTRDGFVMQRNLARGSEVSDFLKKDVRTPLSAGYLAAGIGLRIETNSEVVLSAAAASLQPSEPNVRDLRLKLWVEDGRLRCPDLPRPYFRGLGHLVFSGYCDRSSLLINLRERCGAGRLTRALAETRSFWKTVFFPSLLGIVGPGLGLTSLHSACVAWKGNGLLLAGGAAAGKSTLSLALALRGMDYLSDDRTMISDGDGRLRAWGSVGEMKQRPEGARYFEALRGVEPGTTFKGECAYRFDPVPLFGVRRVLSCDPAWVVFLERQPEPGFALEAVSADEAAWRLRNDLRRENADISKRQLGTVEALARKSCYVLRYGGDPHAIAGALHYVFVGLGKIASRAPDDRRIVRSASPRPDPLGRFRATTLSTNVDLMGRPIRIETDSPGVLARVSRIFDASKPVPEVPRFRWRIVCEAPKRGVHSWPEMTAFCEGPSRYISFGQRSFLAVDLDAREGIGFLPESLCEDEIGFSTVFLASMVHLSAPALGLTAVSAACVAREGRALLLFGPPNSGKTTASYRARALGLDFHSDQATFLESEGGAVRAWGDFWPAAFRPETAQFIPGLSAEGRSFTYRDREFLCVDKEPRSVTPRRSVSPAACIFLERRAASSPRLVPVPETDLAAQGLTDAGSEEDREAIARLIGRLPAYRLLYGDDPYVAALFLRSVLDAECRMEQRA